jgi:hypothetical protein
MDLGGVLEAYPSHRQSLLATFDNCSLSALFGLEKTPYTNAAQARGIIFHRTAAEILRTLKRENQVRMAVQDALQILYEQSAQRDVPPEDIVTVPMRERRLLRIAVIKLVKTNTFRMSRLIAVERQLSTIIRYHDAYGIPIDRLVTGHPDALLADPPTRDDPVPGAIVLDWKMSLAAPPEGNPDDHWDRPHSVSYMGYFQQRFYALLVLRTYPSVMRVRLREFYPLLGVARYGTVYRQDLEHLESEYAVLVELLDRALMGGSESKQWQPSPGAHCSYCPSPTRCPIAADVRARDGGIATWPEARRAAGEYVLAKQIGSDLHNALKAWMDAHGGDHARDYIPVKSAKGRYGVGYVDAPSGRRQFKQFVLPASDRAPDPRDPELDAAFREATTRAEST